jgi:hypothetical protein
MRTIKFRGKTLGRQGEWKYGHLAKLEGYYHIINEQDKFVVDPYSVGEFIGLLDFNGKEIYEGDIIQAKNGLILRIIYNADYIRFQGENPHDNTFFVDKMLVKQSEYKVIGNMNDNPKLFQY